MSRPWRRYRRSALALILTYVGSVSASLTGPTLIPVPRGSFGDELPIFSVPDGGATLALIDGWTFYGSSGQNGSVVVGGIQNQLDAQYTGATFVSPAQPGDLPGTAHGPQNAFITLQQTTNPEFGAIIRTDPWTNAVGNLQYELVVAVGHRKDVPSGDLTISLLADTVPVASETILASSLEVGNFVDASVSWFADPSFHGQSLGIELRMDVPAALSDPRVFQGNFDNLRLFYEIPQSPPPTNTVPEPSSSIVWAAIVALIGCTTRTARRRWFLFAKDEDIPLRGFEPQHPTQGDALC